MTKLVQYWNGKTYRVRLRDDGTAYDVKVLSKTPAGLECWRATPDGRAFRAVVAIAEGRRN